MTTETRTLGLAKQLISIPSVTPEDLGCQELLAERLQHAGFTITKLRQGKVDNLMAIYGDSGPMLGFAGHTDVVAEGSLADWQYPPYTPTVANGILHGRGAQDMKGAIAAMVTAAEDFVAQNPTPRGRLGLFITSGEEGQDYRDGTPVMMQHLQQQQDKLTWCIVGEPSSQHRLGDTIRNGRRGSLKAFLTIKGKQGHVAYPHLAHNPIHAATDFLHQLVREQWCEGNEFFPATTMQCANICSNTQAINVIPGEIDLWVAFRFSPAISHEEIQQRFAAMLAKHDLRHELTWELSGEPFLTRPGELIDAVEKTIDEQLGISPELSTSGGTSDARFIAPTGAQVIELGTTNDKIHQVNEAVPVAQLGALSGLYLGIAERLLGGQQSQKRSRDGHGAV